MPTEAARQAQRAQIFADFFHTLNLEGDFDRATVAMTRRLLERSEPNRARISLQVFTRNEQLRPIAEICLGLCAYSEGLPDPAWALFDRSELALVLKWAADEYFALAFRVAPQTALRSLTQVVQHEVPMQADPHVWLQIAYYTLSAGALDLAHSVLERADHAITRIADQARQERLGLRAANLRTWLARAAASSTPVEVPAGEIPFALVGYQHPDWLAMSSDLDDVTETLAAAGHLLRHDGVHLTGDRELVSALEALRGDMPSGRRIAGAAATVHLYEIHQDTSRLASVPDGTWLIVSEWFARPLAGWRYDLPLDPRLRPIFVSFRITPDELAVPGAADYLRAHGPIGCRDWDSVFLLHAAGVPAFFSGELVSTVDTVLAPRAVTAPAGTVLIDVPRGPDGEPRTQNRPSIREHGLGANLRLAADELRGLRDTGVQVVASSVRCELAARAVGCPAELRAGDGGDDRVVDYLDLDDTAFAAMQRGISDKVGAAIAAILSGQSEADVYAAWREACAGDVAAAEAVVSDVPADPDLNFDLDQACAVIRAASIVVERSQPVDGDEINVEFSVDQNYKHQLAIVLDSVIQRTDRPVRVFVLCRGLGRDDYDRMTRLFPTVSFVWLPTDDVDYGPIPDKIKWATIVTMDRTMLPEMLPEVDRIIHFDLDALCLADLGELFDVDMEGTAIAAVDSPQPVYLGGLETFRRTARRLRREGQSDIARELILRTHAQHPFDFEIFNAGIMVLDLAKMRADGTVRRYLGYIRRFGVNGQVIMNIYVGRNRKKLSADWNRLVRLEISGRPKVAHWAGPVKPWRGHQYAPGREWWQEQEEHFAARTAAIVANRDAASPARPAE